jgi:hypothetical protein
MSQKVALIYGTAEGKWHGKRFVRALQNAGYEVTNDTQRADIVIAHSGGCLLIPETHSYQAVLLINPTDWPGNSPWRQGARKLAGDARYYLFRKPLYYAQKNLWALFYVLTKWPHNKSLLAGAKVFDLPNTTPIPNAPTILVRNDDDPWCMAELTPSQKRYKRLKVIHLPGDHDDCWLHPDRYVNLLQSEL